MAHIWHSVSVMGQFKVSNLLYLKYCFLFIFLFVLFRSKSGDLRRSNCDPDEENKNPHRRGKHSLLYFSCILCVVWKFCLTFFVFDGPINLGSQGLPHNILRKFVTSKYYTQTLKRTYRQTRQIYLSIEGCIWKIMAMKFCC